MYTDSLNIFVLDLNIICKIKNFESVKNMQYNMPIMQ